MARKMGSTVDMVIGVSVAIIVAAIIFPIALSEWYDADLGESAPSFIDSVWDLVPFFALLALLLVFLNWARGRST